MTTMEGYLRQLFNQAISTVSVGAAVRSRVSCDGDTIRAASYSYPLKDFDSVQIVALGKAAPGMAESLCGILLPHLKPGQRLQGIVVSGALPEHEIAPLVYLVAGHPFPDAASRLAADAVMTLLHRCDARTLLFFLISGGASAMVERPLHEHITISETVTFYKALVHSGLPIVQMNALRKHLSAVKGGRLAQAADGATQCTLIVSDVPDGALDMVGSGPSMPDVSTAADCRRILENSHLPDVLPATVSELLLDRHLEETIKPGAPAFRKASFAEILSNADLLQAVSSFALADQFSVFLDNTCDDWDYISAGTYLLDRLRDLHRLYPRVCLISGGEVSVRLPEHVGTGGRNQQFALWCALQLNRTQEPFTVLSAGTDGLDGNSPAAGAVVDRTTCATATALRLKPLGALEAFDSYSFLSAVSASVVTGPTGNNIRDLRVLIATSEELK